VIPLAPLPPQKTNKKTEDDNKIASLSFLKGF